MRIHRIILAAALLASLTACAATTSPSEIRAVDGTAMISGYAVDKNPARVRIGGKVFTVTKTAVTWDRGGPVALTAGWGLLELRETPAGVEISLDGVVVATAPK